MNACDGAIGIFDSGVGGLTVFRALRECVPAEPMVYLGDTARLPYGTKSPETVIRYARACARVLIKRRIKLLVVACNTASSCALDALRSELDVPVLGVIEPGAQRASEVTRSGRIGIIGTASTIASGAYQQALGSISSSLEVVCAACPLFVPLAEEGWTRGEVPGKVAERYLRPLLDTGIDTLVLGCTHYPLLKETIAETVGPEVMLVDSAEAAADVARTTLEALGLLEESPGPPSHTFLATDAPDAFARVGQRFLGHALGTVEWVDC